MLAALAVAFAVTDAAAEPAGGFRAEPAATIRASLLALTFAPDGTAFAAVEDGPVLWLADGDGDGTLESQGTCTDEVRGAHGLVWWHDALYAVGARAGVTGLQRIRLGGDGRTAAGIEPLARFETISAEHGAHGVTPGPDGGLYVCVGNLARLAPLPEPLPPLLARHGRSILPELPDPSGTSTASRDPGGAIWRVDPRTGEAALHSTGYRNHYRAAFDVHGELFTCDSDMELDVGLPWYLPARVLHCVPGGDYGARKAAGALRVDAIDVLPPLVNVGRASPTAVASGSATRWPEPWRSALFVGDWTGARVLAVHVAAEGATFEGRVEVAFAGPDAQAITDLAAGPDGNLWFTSGGRGERGGVWRLVPPAASRPPLAPELTPVPRSVSTARRLRGACLRDAPTAAELSEARALLGDPDRWTRHAARTALESAPPAELRDLALAGRDPRSTAEALLLLARAGKNAATSDEIVDAALSALARSRESAERNPLWRVIQVALLELGEPAAGLRAALAQRVLAGFAHADTGEQAWIAELLAHLCPPSAVAALTEALARAPSSEHGLHLVRCLGACAGGWTADDGVRALAWLEKAAGRDGAGASYDAWIERLGADVLARLDAEDLAGRLRDDPRALGPRALAQFVAAAPEALGVGLLPLLKARSASQGSLPAVLRLLSDARAAPVRAWLRELAAADGAEASSALAALARHPQVEDLPLLARGLESRDPVLADAAGVALEKLGDRPADPAIAVRAFVHARSAGHLRGWRALAAVARWCGAPEPGFGPVAWPDAVRTTEFALRRTWPDVAIPPESTEERPRWPLETVAAILARSAERTGSASRGAAVFERATCSRCHVAPGAALAQDRSPGLVGPDLSGLHLRMDRARILESIWDPSATIPDPFRAWLVETTDEVLHTGRLVRDDARGVALLDADGRVREIARESVAALRPSTQSPMPAGLLADATLEDVRDLLAFLEGAAAPAGAADTAWSRPLEGLYRSAWEGDPRLWKLEAGLLEGRARNLARSSWLVSKDEWSDFELEFDVRITRGGNSGVQYRSRIDPGSDDPVGYQADVGQIFWGSLYATDGRGMLHEPDAWAWRRVVDIEGWNHYHVLVDGDRHRIEVNGAVLTDVRDTAHAAGRLAFQLHGDLEMDVRFANVRIRPLR